MTKASRKGGGAGRGHAVSGFFIFCLIGLFAVLAATLTLVSISAYRNVYEASTGNSEGQIVLSYLRNKVRASDRAGGVAVDSLGGRDVLCLRETLGGEEYETRVYCYGGSLCEYFCAAEEAFDPELGEALAPLQSLSLRMETPWLLAAEIRQEDGATLSARMALRADGTEREPAVPSPRGRGQAAGVEAGSRPTDAFEPDLEAIAP